MTVIAPSAQASQPSPRVPYSRTKVSPIVVGVVATLAALIGAAIWSLWETDWSARPPSMLGLTAAALVLILAVGAIFSCFTVEVREETLGWWFGLGAFRHEVRLSAIAEANLSRTSRADLVNLLKRGQERAYGMSGGEAVALRLHDGSRLKLLAREPEALLAVLRR